MEKTLLISGEKEPFLWALMRILGKSGNDRINIRFPASEKDFDEEVAAGTPEKTVILINTSGNTPELVNKWVWRKLRLNEKKIGKDKSGLPVIVLGPRDKFLETPEGKVFRDFPQHHKYITKPLNLYRFLLDISHVYPINPHSLCVIQGDAPGLLIGALEHDLANILQKFDFDGSDEEVGERFHRIEIDLENYLRLKKNSKKLAKIRKEVKILKDEILKRRGNIWQ